MLAARYLSTCNTEAKLPTLSGSTVLEFRSTYDVDKPVRLLCHLVTSILTQISACCCFFSDINQTNTFEEPKPTVNLLSVASDILGPCDPALVT